MVQPLTNRERQILDLLGQWLQNKEIAAKLLISPLTVKKHLDKIYGKLNVSGRRQTVEKAKKKGNGGIDIGKFSGNFNFYEAQ